MMKKKGMTLVELIISIALISIILVFLFSLLSDVKFIDRNRNFASSNQQKRAIILKRVQTDFIERRLGGLKDRSNSNSIVLDFNFLDGTTATLSFYQDGTGYYVNYKNANSEEKWYIDTDNTTTKLGFNCVKYSLITEPENSNYFAIKFNIPVIAKSNDVNTIDDFEFTYIGEKEEVNLANFPNKASLGTYNINTCG